METTFEQAALVGVERRPQLGQPPKALGVPGIGRLGFTGAVRVAVQ
ncbi:MAG TPA: hypothetical protein VM143_17730 [Acidimicrobiales bacterium]|nr:hypothetical protein [Acidimicrobiales bacterium]